MCPWVGLVISVLDPPVAPFAVGWRWPEVQGGSKPHSAIRYDGGAGVVQLDFAVIACGERWGKDEFKNMVVECPPLGRPSKSAKAPPAARRARVVQRRARAAPNTY